MSKIKAFLEVSIFKTILLNFRCLPIHQAIKVPIIISKYTRLKSLKGNIIISAKISTGMIKLGFGDHGLFDKKYNRSLLQIERGGVVTFNGKANLGNGFKLCVFSCLSIGSGFSLAASSMIFCNDNIRIGNDCLLSWDILIMDSDIHKIYQNFELVNPSKEINIGDNVWIGCRCTILKGTKVSKGTVIGSGSLVSGEFNKENTIIAGVPAKVIKEDITWKR